MHTLPHIEQGNGTQITNLQNVPQIYKIYNQSHKAKRLFDLEMFTTKKKGEAKHSKLTSEAYKYEQSPKQGL